MVDKVQKIREEVERLKEIAEYNISHSKMDRSAWMQQASVCTNLLSFINSLQKEPASEDLEQAIDNYLATYFGGEKEKQDWPYLKKMAIHFAEWQKQKDSIPVSEDLGEASRNYADSEEYGDDVYFAIKAAFKAGANWQKQQLMAKAVDMVVGYWMPNGLMLTVDETENYYNIDEGDKYKVILIKED